MDIIVKKRKYIQPGRRSSLPGFRILFMLLLIFLSLLKSCVVPYIPEPLENEEMLVVEGLISDQRGINTIKLSKSIPLWEYSGAKPLKGCKVWIYDDQGNIDTLKETTVGIYVTDSSKFKGEAGRKYTLHISTNAAYGNKNYESFPIEMKPSPQIESMYYEKEVYELDHRVVEGCRIYLDTYDPFNNTNFYRWDYSETWEFRLPYDVPNRVCWLTNNSNGIFIKNTSLFSEDRVSRYPINTISDPVDKLNVKYSILVKQYALTEDEYLYWERLKNTFDQVGGLYDLIPSVIPNNLFCVENPDENILGYFSVSAVSTKRIFIKDNFLGFNTKYVNCISDTIYGTAPIEGLNEYVWVLKDNTGQNPPSRIITYNKGCADCRVRGTSIKPLFWQDDK